MSRAGAVSNIGPCSSQIYKLWKEKDNAIKKL